MSTKIKIPLFKPADLDATIGVFFDGFSKVIIAIAVLMGTFSLSTDMVFGKAMPGLAFGSLLLHGALWLYYRKIAQQRGDADLVAIPAGIQAGRLFIWLFSIMLPVFLSTNDANLAFYVGVLANLFGSIVFIAGAFFVPPLIKIVPPAALFGALGGAALAFLVLQSISSIFVLPLAGWIALLTLFTIYLGRIEIKIPAALISIGIGATVAWATGKMSIDAVGQSLQTIGLYLPRTDFAIFTPEVISHTLNYLPIIIIFSIGEVIGGIQAVEQAKEVGDDYFEAKPPLVIAGVTNLISAFFGNFCAFGLYWGYPGWKKVNAGTGYHLGAAIIFLLIGYTGLAAIINVFIPEAVVLPILMFIGIVSVSQAFEVVDKKYFPATIAAIAFILVQYIKDNAAPESFPSFEVLRYGAVFIAMIFASILTYIIDNKWINVSYAALIGLGLTLIGMIHSPGLIFTASYQPNMEFTAIYTITALVFFILEKIQFNKKANH
ncbi:MAG: permease [Brevinema sp.]